jgi:mono/diheme cytochrome c family protein
VAVGPDGALYISDDKNGRVWRVTYSGDRTAALQAAPAAGDTASSSSPVLPPEGIHPDAGVMAPPGVKPETVALGGRIFRGEEDGGPCIGCHGADARGGPLGGDLTGGKWLWANGSLSSIKQVIESGVPHPKAHAGAMPPKGGAALSEADVDALAGYVWSISRKKVAGK